MCLQATHANWLIHTLPLKTWRYLLIIKCGICMRAEVCAGVRYPPAKCTTKAVNSCECRLWLRPSDMRRRKVPQAWSFPYFLTCSDISLPFSHQPFKLGKRVTSSGPWPPCTIGSVLVYYSNKACHRFMTQAVIRRDRQFVQFWFITF